ncbi:hypothetical protein AAFF_G00124870 [Aldrovandia affinis]|uniref:G-protein coupled receptors family 3 profile domain-containing protein n=1 Tax=Aldrovandia affinis TaxID=143900 RepID=A0AAD7RTX9_9TELE|nr:hypothetical protein AAFF_G00124870 [Aldrovandia affinis]
MMDLLTMVNYGSSSSSLSDKRSYQSFLRTVSSNSGQVQLIIRILQRFGWNWVAFIGCNNEYSRDALHLFNDGIRNTNICLAYQEELKQDTKYNVTFHNINMLHINVIIVYTLQSYAIAFIDSAILKKQHDKVWIASDAWSLNKVLRTHKGVDTIGTIIGVTERVQDLPGFPDFVYKSLAHSKHLECEKEPLQDFMPACNQACNACSSVHPKNITNEDPSYNFAIYSAVYVVAKALHNLLHCDTNGCNKTELLYPYKLLKEIKKSNFTLLNQQIKFDENGDPPSRYNIVFWNLASSSPFQHVGSYDTNPTVQFHMNDSLIRWHTNGTIPVSRCSEECEKGSARRPYGIFKCCFECDVCPNGTYINNSAGPFKCIACKKTEWSNPGSTSCEQRSVEYVHMTEHLSILLLLSVSFMFALAAAIGVLFACNYSTPVVKSAGGKMCFLMLGCLSCSGVSVFFYFGVPNHVKCALRNPIFALFYTVCLSCLTVRSFQIVCVFKMAAKLPRAYDWWVKHNGQWLFIAVASTVQLIFCALSSLKPHNDTVTCKKQIIMGCDTGSPISSSTGIYFIGFVGMLCFIFSYMGTDLPKNYNESKSITFSVLLFYMSWIAYFTIYSIYKGKYLPVFNAFSILTSSCGILLSYFMPKCYVILFQPEKNTQAHFQSSIQDYTQKISRM